MRKKEEIITFKVSRALYEAMQGIPNRSEFIREAIVTALQSVCPLCRGTGIMSPSQKSHWETFSKDHEIEECHDCRELHLVCKHNPPGGDRR